MTAAPDAVLVVRGLVKRYGDRTAVDGVDLDGRAGEVTALLGPNGAGKTSTVECCVGLRLPNGGTVRVLGRDPGRAGADLRARVGVMLQDGGLPSQARPVELLRHLAGLYARPLDVDALSATLGIDGFARTTVRRMSGGQRQRVALAAAVVGRPRLVFLDEPTAGLDPQARHVVWDVVRDLCADGVAVVLTTHDMEEANRLATTVVIVDHGRVVARGAPEELTGTSGGASVRFRASPSLDLESLRRALPGDVLVTEPRPGEYVVAGRIDPSVVASVTSWCAAHGLMPDELAVGRRSLEDVFLDLTGHGLR
ncbi:MAG: ABC transporter ATP-binding protein [Actinomycetes bacterium]